MILNEKLENLKKNVINCKKCDLYRTRTNSVFGNGKNDSEIFFIGEAPGRNEDKQGLPFVGRAGKILDELLDSINIDRNDVYISNIIKCRPPKNRNPKKSEIDICSKYLNDQLDIIKPKLIIPLGNYASMFILEKFGYKVDKISNIHGKIFPYESKYGEIKIIAMYHPAAVIYNPNKKEILFRDFKNIKKVLEA